MKCYSFNQNGLALKTSFTGDKNIHETTNLTPFFHR